MNTSHPKQTASKTTTRKKRDLYNYQQRLERSFEMLQHETPKENVDLIGRYHKQMLVEGRALGTRYLHVERLKSLTRRLKCCKCGFGPLD